MKLNCFLSHNKKKAFPADLNIYIMMICLHIKSKAAYKMERIIFGGQKVLYSDSCGKLYKTQM